ncbi:uracil-DNA glycosylase [Mesomycoplasma moatsii]|uniref:uracil-DNA glycosylase n=1 Tax=Mesomycoplasma moatsii TaxID=171287 RepID=UPI0003B719A8
MKQVDIKVKGLINSDKTQSILEKIYSNSEQNVFPKKENIFKALELCPLSQTKVVIFGQDPYYQINVADGLAFSSQNKITPASLKNIFKEIKNEYPNATFNTNDLSCWAKQGVLLLNSSLTVVEQQPMSHNNKWDFFINEIINFINNDLEVVIFLLWGSNAKKFKKQINDKHFVLTSAHPSPLSADKGFFNNGHFKRVNEILKLLNKKEINWST